MDGSKLWGKERYKRGGYGVIWESRAGIAVKMHSSKKVLPCIYFRGNKYSPVYISLVKITPGITFFSRK